MNSDRWKKIEALYNSALSIDVDKRLAWLAEGCEGDESLRLDVISLLDSANTDDSFLEEPALSLGLTVLGLESNQLIGENLGRYEVISSLGHGGMGEVYLAHDPRLNRRVALKLLPTNLTENRNRVLRFQQEARLASAISHPNVAHIYEIGESEGRHYITMEYVKGLTLRQMLRRGALVLDEALGIAIQVAAALAAAHRAGVIHRDIKPENILIAEDGFAKVLDFGLAKLTEEGAESQAKWESRHSPSLHTEPELFMGTSHYMSPEQVRRQLVDLRTDLWSLGVVTYEMLTSRRPFQGQSFREVIIAIIETEPEFAGDESAIPQSAQTLLRKALKKQPSERYQTASELLTDLRRVRESTQPPDPSTNYRQHAKTTNRRAAQPGAQTAGQGRLMTIPERLDTVEDESAPRRSLLSSPHIRAQALVVLFLIVGATAYYSWSSRSSNTLVKKPLSLRFERLTLPGNVSDITISPDGKYVASVMTEAGMKVIHVTELATASDLRVGLPSREGYSGISFSVDGTYVYYLENHAETGTLNRVSKLGGGQRKILENVNTPVSFSPDGERMAFVRSKASSEPADLVIARVDGSSEKVLVKRSLSDQDFFLSDMKGAGPAWSPIGNVLACPTFNLARINEVNIEIVDVEGGTSRRLNKNPWYDISRVVWLADGSGLVLAVSEGPGIPYQLQLLAYPTGEVRKVTNDPNSYALVSATRDSGLLLTLNIEEDSNLWQVPPGKNTQPTLLKKNQRKGLAEVESDGGSRLFYTVSDGIHTNLWSQSFDSLPQQLTFESDNAKPTASRDGRYIVFVSKRNGVLNIWRINSDGTHPLQLTSGAYEDLPVVTPDSKWVLYRSGNSIRKVSIDGGTPIKLLTRSLLGIALSPSGEWLAGFANDHPDSVIWHIEIYDVSTLKMIKRLELPERTTPFNETRWARDNRLHWAPDGSALAYISGADGNSNIWSQMLRGGTPQKLTSFQDAEISSFSWLPGNQGIVCIRNFKAYAPVLVRIF